MIDGLKLTFTGEELHRLLQERAARHRGAIVRLGVDDDDAEEEVQLPEHLVAEMIERHHWRAEVLDFLRAHLEAADTYRLGPHDLEFAELLPEAPDEVEEERYRAASGLAFQVSQLVRSLSRLHDGVFKMSLVDCDSTADAEIDTGVGDMP